MAVQEPRYVLELHDGPFEVRRYAPRIVAETRITDTSFDAAGNEGFRRLAGYIFGKNRARQRVGVAMTAPLRERRDSRKLAMTAPVGERSDSGAWVITFTMPVGETLATLPLPDDDRVVLREATTTRVAVYRFSGRWSDARFTTKTEALRAWIGTRGMAVVGESEVARYNPPWAPWFLRRNEIWWTLATP
ncbi:MAG: SOUL family heme-binding protein [Kofleriaceae bacterium]